MTNIKTSNSNFSAGEPRWNIDRSPLYLCLAAESLSSTVGHLLENGDARVAHDLAVAIANKSRVLMHLPWDCAFRALIRLRYSSFDTEGHWFVDAPGMDATGFVNTVVTPLTAEEL